jgi:MoxR-like ATPase
MKDNEELPEEINLDQNGKEPTTNPSQSYGFERSNADLIWLSQRVNDIRSEVGKYIIGQQEMVELLMVGVFSAGHVLLEGVPGVAKTLASKVLAKIIDVQFSRIQFTPDLMPSDVIGTSIFNSKTASFSFKKGPVFSNIVLIDEINRAPAKTQAALFEVMEERQISYDGQVYVMDVPFLVVATQNPVEQEGTYNLPEAQLDRFLFKINLEYPSLEQEITILNRFKNDIKAASLDQIKPVLNAKDIVKVHGLVANMIIEDNLIAYVATIVDKTRKHGKLFLGGSPRASLAIVKSAKAFAAIRGRDFVTPDDIQFVAPHVLNHRLILTPEAEMEGTTTFEIIAEIVQSIEVPR